MFPAKTVFSVVSATQLGICKGELLKLLELRILVLAQLNDLCPKQKQRSCKASQAWRLASFLKMRLEDPAAGTDHVAFTEAMEGHMFNLSLSDFRESICHGTIMTLFITRDWWFSSHILGHTCNLTGHVFLTQKREGRATDLWGRGGQLPKPLGWIFLEWKGWPLHQCFAPSCEDIHFSRLQVIVKAISLTDQVHMWYKYIQSLMAKLIDVASGSDLIYASPCWFAHSLRVLFLSLICSQ